MTEQHAAVVRAGVVENVIVIAAIEDVQTPAWVEHLAGADVVEVAAGVVVGSGWVYDPQAEPPFTQPADPDGEPLP